MKTSAVNTVSNSQYDTQANDFLARFNIRFSAVLADSKPAPWADEEKHPAPRHHFKITLSKPQGKPTTKAFDVLRGGKVIDTVFYNAGQHITANEVLRSLQNHDGVDCDAVRRAYRRAPRLVFDFWASSKDHADGVHTVRAYDILSCISSDAFCPDTFADFCAELGYDEDSRKAEKTFKACSSFARRIQKFFTEEELTALSEIN